MRARGRGVAAGMLLAMVAVGACSAGQSEDAGGGEAASGAADSTVPQDAPATDLGQGTGSGRAARTVVRTQAVIKTGHVIIASKDPADVLADIEDLTASLGGGIDKAETSHETGDGTGDGIENSHLVLRVPVARFDDAMDAVEELGRLEYSEESEKDVTTQVIDVAERVETLRNSLDNLQRFQRDATNVRDLLRYEQEITERSAQLQSLQQQQTYLVDQTSLSTIEVDLSRPEKVQREEGPLADAGFLAGLRSGWDGLVGFGIIALTLLGLALPFVVAGVVVGVPGWLALREALRRRRAGTQVTS